MGIDDEKRMPVNIRLPESMVDKIDALARAGTRNRTMMIQRAIEEYLKTPEAILIVGDQSQREAIRSKDKPFSA